MFHPSITFKDSAFYHSRLQRNRHLSKTFSTVLIVEGLVDEMSSQYILELFDSVKEVSKGTIWIYREAPNVAYVCCKTPYAAEAIQLALNGYNPSEYDRSSTQSFSKANDLLITFAPLFIEKKYLDLIYKILHPLPKLVTTNLKVVSSVKLCSTDWLTLFPTAYNIIKTVDQTKVLIEFRCLQEAQESFKSMNGACVSLNSLKNGPTSVLLGCQFVTKQYVKSKLRFCNNRLNELYEAEDKLMNSVVEWLYTGNV